MYSLTARHHTGIENGATGLVMGSSDSRVYASLIMTHKSRIQVIKSVIINEHDYRMRALKVLLKTEIGDEYDDIRFNSI